MNDAGRYPVDPAGNVTGLVLAGGRARRWGGEDKGLAMVAGRPMIEHVLTALEPQVYRVVISANRNLERYRRYGWPVVEDADGRYDGPLAGIVAGMRAADTPWIAVVPCDAPTVPADLVSRLAAAANNSRAAIAVAHDGARRQPLFSLIAGDRLATIERYLASGRRSAEGWLDSQAAELVDFSECPENFLNINRREDQAGVEARLASGRPEDPAD